MWFSTAQQLKETIQYGNSNHLHVRPGTTPTAAHIDGSPRVFRKFTAPISPNVQWKISLRKQLARS